MVLTLHGLLSTISHIILFTLCYVRTMRKQQSIVGYFLSSDISTFGDTFQFATSITSISAIYVCSFIKRKELVKFFEGMSNIDANFAQLDHKKNYTGTLALIWINLVVMFILYTTYLSGSYLLLHRSSIYPEISVWVACFLPFYMICLSIVFHGCLLKEVESRFVTLNSV